MDLEFLRDGERKIVRTALYNDQEFTTWELELLHTPVLQRLYNLKQLGFADRVFPDAVHSRLNHVLGVAEMAERMADRLVRWLEKHPSADFAYVDDTSSARQEWRTKSVTGADLAKHVRANISVIRLIGLLHDITHAAFGHTLEDEVCVFSEKHDDPLRQKRFFDALTAQLLYFWAVELGTQAPDADVLDSLVHLEIDATKARTWAEELREALGSEKSERLAVRLRELELACSLLSYIEFLHKTDQDAIPPAPPLVVSDAITALNPTAAPLDLVLHRDAFFVDIVGNTICADLLDYARRDAQNAGLRIQFDERLIRYVCSVSVAGELSPTGKPCIRLALQFFTDKMRHDVLSEMSGILKARYLITERVLFHPTKCAAGAMLGTSVQLLGIRNLPGWMQIIGDQEFLTILVQLAQRMRATLANGGESGEPARPTDRLGRLVESCLTTLAEDVRSNPSYLDPVKRVDGARVLLWRLISRRYPKAVFRLRSGLLHSGGDGDEALAKKYTDGTERFRLEREVEHDCNLPAGSVVIHCPKRRMSMKVAQALVVGDDLSKVAHLRDVDKVTPEPLAPYHDEIKAVEQMYRAIWQFHAFLDSSQYDKRALVETILAARLHFPNDELLGKQLVTRDTTNGPYALLAGELRGEYAFNRLPAIVRRLDDEGAMRMRHGGGAEAPRERVLRVIRAVEEEQRTGHPPGGNPSGDGIPPEVIQRFHQMERARPDASKATGRAPARAHSQSEPVVTEGQDRASASRGNVDKPQLPMFGAGAPEKEDLEKPD